MAAKPPAERSEANKVSIYLYMFSTRHLQCPSGVQRTKPYDEREARVWWDGTGRDGEQKCPLKIFILCWYIAKVYTYLYMW